MSCPKAILLDADGVTQLPRATLRRDLAAACNVDELPEKFLIDVFAAEDTCLTGNAEFHNVLVPILRNWNFDLGVDEFLALWNQIEPVEAIFCEVKSLRDRGICVGLASNQQRHRAKHMSEVLGYAANFDHLFFSCTVGFSKPSAEFFSAILDALRLPPHSVLFIDDHDENVSAARACGLAAEVFHARSGISRFQELLSAHRVFRPAAHPRS